MLNYDPFADSSPVQGTAGFVIPGSDRPINAPQGLSYADYVSGLSALLWLRLRETSGNPANSGSASLTIAQANCTQGVDGLLGEDEAYTYNATTSTITINNSASLNALWNFTYAFLCYPNSAGENNAARLWNWGNANHRTEINANQGFTTIIEATGGNATTTCANNTLTFGAWQWVFVTFDNTDKTVRHYIGRNGAVTQPSYTTQTPAAVNPPATRGELLALGNRQLVDTTWDGLFDEMLIIGRVLTTGEMTSLTQLSGA